MLDLVRNAIQLTFTALYAIIMVLTVIFVLPVVWIKEWLAEHRTAKQPAHWRVPKALALFLIVSGSALLLAGCTVNINRASQTVQNTVQNSVERSRQVLDRTLEFARSAPEAPYKPAGNKRAFDIAARENSLQLDATQLTLIDGAAKATKTYPATHAFIIEQDGRWLDDGELERDVLSALAGEDSSVGLGQVRVSTAKEIEQEDPFDVFPKYATDDTSNTERVRRLANDDWNILYVATYVHLLQTRYPNDGPLDLAQRYVGATPSSPKKGEQAELYDIFKQIY